MYYLDVDFYRYYIGREDQSVNEKNMIKNIDQQIKVNKIMVDAYDLWKIADRHLRHYMMNYLEIITVISTVMLLKSGTEENLEKKRELWTYIKNRDIRLFHKLRNRIMGQTLNLPGKGGRKLSLTIYKISQKVIGFNLIFFLFIKNKLKLFQQGHEKFSVSAASLISDRSRELTRKTSGFRHTHAVGLDAAVTTKILQRSFCWNSFSFVLFTQ